MYHVYLVTDGEEERVKVLIDNNDPNDVTHKLLSPQLELEENSFGSLTFSVYNNHACASYFQLGDAEIEVYRTYMTEVEGETVEVDEDLPLFRGRMLEVKTSASTIKTYTFEGEMSYLQDSIQVPANYENYTPKKYVEALLAVHNKNMPPIKQFTVGNITVTDDDTSDHITGRVNRGSYQTTYSMTTWDCLRSMLDELGGFFQIRYDSEGVRYLDYLKDHVKRNPTPTIQLGANLIEYADEWSLAELYTVIVPLGADYQTTDANGSTVTVTTTIASVNNNSVYLEAPAATLEKYGRREKAVDFKGILDPTHLKKIAQLYLSNTQFDGTVLNLTAIDLSNLGQDVTKIVFEEVVVVVADIYIESGGLEFPVTKVSIPLKNPAGAIYTMSKNSRMIRSMSTKITDYDKDAQDAINDLKDDVTDLKQIDAITTNELAGVGTWFYGYPIILYRTDELLTRYLRHPDYILRAWDAGQKDLNLWPITRTVAGNQQTVNSKWPEAVYAADYDDIVFTDATGWYYSEPGVGASEDNWGLTFPPYSRGWLDINVQFKLPLVVYYVALRFAEGTNARFGFTSTSPSINQGVYFGVDENGHLGYTSSTDGRSTLTALVFNGSSGSSYVDGTKPFVLVISTSEIMADSYTATAPSFFVVSGNDLKVSEVRFCTNTTLRIWEESKMNINYAYEDTEDPSQVSDGNEVTVARIVECGGLAGQITATEVINNGVWLCDRFVTQTLKSDSEG